MREIKTTRQIFETFFGCIRVCSFLTLLHSLDHSVPNDQGISKKFIENIKEYLVNSLSYHFFAITTRRFKFYTRKSFKTKTKSRNAKTRRQQQSQMRLNHMRVERNYAAGESSVIFFFSSHSRKLNRTGSQGLSWKRRAIATITIKKCRTYYRQSRLLRLIEPVQKSRS